jgi:hypothetical protein
MRILTFGAIILVLQGLATARGHGSRPSDPEYGLLWAATVLDGYQRAVTFLGGEDANCRGAGPTITGLNRGLGCSGLPPAVSNCHFLRNLSVGMERSPDAASCVGGLELAGDTKPTIANRIFAADHKMTTTPGHQGVVFP